MNDILLSAHELHKSYGHLKVLKGVSISIKKGELVSIVGTSGAGKSTLLHIIGTIDPPDSGTLQIENKFPFQLKDKELAQFRNEKIGFVFQFHHLLPEFTAIENVAIPKLIHGKVKPKEAHERAAFLLQKLGLADRMHHKPSQLSGGEQQRVAVARALVNEPLLVLADEPTGNLDSANAAQLHQLFLTLKNEWQQTFVIVTHNQQLANMSDRILTMKDGKIVDA